MREIKFRGICKGITNIGVVSEGEWVYGYYYAFCGKSYILGDPVRIIDNALWVEVIPETVGQSTGLYDKNGVEIYGGDILQAPKHCRYLVQFINNGWHPFAKQKVLVQDCEVIGDTHTTPELLKG